jgi:hypothetical protein
MDIQQLERELKCLQCEAARGKVHDCAYSWDCPDCQKRLAEAYLKLQAVWDRRAEYATY